MGWLRPYYVFDEAATATGGGRAGDDATRAGRDAPPAQPPPGARLRARLRRRPRDRDRGAPRPHGRGPDRLGPAAHGRRAGDPARRRWSADAGPGSTGPDAHRPDCRHHPPDRSGWAPTRTEEFFPMADSSDRSSHGDYVPDGGRVRRPARHVARVALGRPGACASRPSTSRSPPSEHHYTYQWEWAGVPVIRIPDDVMVLQELFWSYRPERVVETGVARGGSMLLNASLMRCATSSPRCSASTTSSTRTPRRPCRSTRWAAGSSCSRPTRPRTRRSTRSRTFIDGAERVVLVLDSNHTHDHVLGELRALAPLLPSGGLVLVADTLVEEFPEGHFDGRPWDRGDNPMTAVRAFLDENDDFTSRPRVGPPGAGHRVPRRDPASPLRSLRREARAAAPASAVPLVTTEDPHRRERGERRPPAARPWPATAGRPAAAAPGRRSTVAATHAHAMRSHWPSAPSAACCTTPMNMPLLAAASTARLATPRV